MTFKLKLWFHVSIWVINIFLPLCVCKLKFQVGSSQRGIRCGENVWSVESSLKVKAFPFITLHLHGIFSVEVTQSSVTITICFIRLWRSVCGLVKSNLNILQSTISSLYGHDFARWLLLESHLIVYWKKQFFLLQLVYMSNDFHVCNFHLRI